MTMIKETKKKKFNGFTLTVNGLPPLTPGEGKIYGASLMAEDDLAPDSNPVAIGVPNSGVFCFYHPSEGNPRYTGDEEFITADTYNLLIVKTYILNPTEPEAIYMYIGGEDGTYIKQ